MDLFGDDPFGGGSKRKTIPKSIKNEVLVQQDYKCANCGSKLPARKHFHHITPVSEGGDNSIDNVEALCPNCHSEIHHRMQLKKHEDDGEEEDDFAIDFKPIDFDF